MQMEKSMIVKLLHSVPHINVSLHMVNSTFNPNSDVYIEVREGKDEFIFNVNVNLMSEIAQKLVGRLEFLCKHNPSSLRKRY